ncbi:MAG TPA: cell division protein FtsW [bacterium (Candidatus Stahlbacteria)]|nr:cell division protein FtsW [Candidatus Stahlbacteria bacterium]
MKKIDVKTILIVATLITVGLIMVYSSTAFSCIKGEGKDLIFLKRQALSVAIGILLCLLISKIDYHIWGRYSPLLLGIAIVLLFYVAIFSPPVHGVRRWIKIRNFSLQPAEFTKFVVIMYVSKFLASSKKMRDARQLIPLLFVLGTVFYLLVREPSFGMLAVLFTVILSMLFISGMKLSYLILTLTFGALILFFAINQVAYAKARLWQFLDGENPQLEQSLISLGAGGIFGVGLGNSSGKLFLLPTPHTDFMFSVMGEEIGLLGCLGILFLFLLLLIRGIKIGMKSKDLLGAFLSIGVALSIFVSAVFHVGVACGILPTTGVPLPFISYGGNSLIANLMAIGIILNIYKQNVTYKNEGYYSNWRNRRPYFRRNLVRR